MTAFGETRHASWTTFMSAHTPPVSYFNAAVINLKARLVHRITSHIASSRNDDNNFIPAKRTTFHGKWCEINTRLRQTLAALWCTSASARAVLILCGNAFNHEKVQYANDGWYLPRMTNWVGCYDCHCGGYLKCRKITALQLLPLMQHSTSKHVLQRNLSVK